MIKKAFTLLEMLVVIGIIGVLVGIGAVSYSTAQKKARDAKRKQDLKAIQNCLEQYYSYNNNFKYPITSNAWPSPLNCGSYTMSVPLDPKTGTGYEIMDYDSEGSKYKICPPVVRSDDSNSYYLETEDCTYTNDKCCIFNQQ